MSQRAELIRTAIKLGLFVAVCSGFTLWLAFTIGNIQLFQGTYQLSATFDDATGLLRDDNVKIAGVAVGKVNSVSVDQGRAKVQFEVHDDVTVPSNAVASIRWRNLLGQRYVYLEPPDDPAPTRFADGDTVTETVSTVDLGELFNRLGPIVGALDPTKVNTFIDAVGGALDGNETNLREVLADLATLTARLAARDETIARLVTNLDTVVDTIASRESQIRAMFDNLVTIAETFSANTDVLEAAIDEIGAFADDLGGILTNNADHVDSIVASLDVVVDVVAANLGNLDTVLGNIDETTESLFRTGSTRGTWLNQVIPCLTVVIAPLDVPCDTAGIEDTEPAPVAASTSAVAIGDLLGAAMGSGDAG